MTTRLFKKPDLRENSVEITESVYRDPRELERIKETVKPEVYLQKLYAKIEEKEREYSQAEVSYKEQSVDIEQHLENDRSAYKKAIDSLESILILKREEHTALEKPLDEKWQRMNERDLKQDEREKLLDARQQSLFESEHTCDVRFELIQDMADELSESRVRLASKERQVTKREELIIDREAQYMARIDSWNSEEERRRNDLQTIQFEIQLVKLNLDGKEENLVKREKVLSDGLILLADRRGVLERAWKELENKYGSKSNSTSISAPKRS